MEVIISGLVKLMKEAKPFLSREKAMMLFFIELVCLIVQQAFKQLDDEFFGTVTYKRRRLKNSEGNSG